MQTDWRIEKELYRQLFPLEIESWIQGVTDYPGEIYNELVFHIIEFAAPAFKKAIACGFAFDILDISMSFGRAAKYLVDERLISFRILSILPDPAYLEADEANALIQVVRMVDNEYYGTMDYIERNWRMNKQLLEQSGAAAPPPLKMTLEPDPDQSKGMIRHAPSFCQFSDLSAIQKVVERWESAIGEPTEEQRMAFTF
jgi:hypothetical protein